MAFLTQLATNTTTNGNISSALLVATYTNTSRIRKVYATVACDQVAGNGSYTCYATVQRAGAGSAYQTTPITTATVASGITSIIFESIAITLNATDVLKVYVLGLAGDTTTPDIIVDVNEEFILTDSSGRVDAYAINSVAASSVTTIGANVGTTQPLNFTGTGASALVKGDAIDFAGQTITAAAGVTLPSSVASPTNITAGTITTVTTLTNAPSDSAGVTTLLTRIAGALTISGGAVNANLVSILGTALTETAGQIAAAFKKVFDVAAPVFTALSVNQSADNNTKLADIQNRIPAALTADGNIKADALKLNGAAPNNLAAGAAMTLTAAYDAAKTAGDATVTNQVTINSNVLTRLATSGYTAPPSASDNATALLDLTNGIETSFTLRQAMRLILAALAGKLSISGNTVTIRDVNDTKDRIVATTDDDGQRTAITKDVS